jgi:hypothetical protein
MTQAAITKESIMEFRKTSRITLAALIVAGTCFSTPALARNHHNGHLVRDILLAPLLLPAAILAASTPQPVIYEETHYVTPPRYVARHRYEPRRDVRRYDNGRYRRYR